MERKRFDDMNCGGAPAPETLCAMDPTRRFLRRAGNRLAQGGSKWLKKKLGGHGT
jgi:hypothetical protein